MSEQQLPPAFAGATHRLADGTPVKAVQWKKDGDHPRVERYPIERREYKGLLRTHDANKLKLALRFGDWILEDAQGRMWVEPSLSSTKYFPIEELPA